MHQRELELEDKIYQFNKHQTDLFEKAKQEVKEEERKKMQSYRDKLERVKQQEIAIIKKELR